MMTVIRWVLAKIILFLNATFVPKAIARNLDQKEKLSVLGKSLALYQFEACPFCVKVRRALIRLGLEIEIKDTKKVPAFEAELLKGGGELQVPCLRITQPDGTVQWMYESSEIITYLEETTAAI